MMDKAAAEAQEIYSFPFQPYEIQKDFMDSVSSVLEEGKIGIFESPTGTGKSLSLICASLTWLRHSDAKKRQELEKVLTGGQKNESDEVSSESDPFAWLKENAASIEKNREMENARKLMGNLGKIDEKVAKIRQKKSRVHRKPFKRPKSSVPIFDGEDRPNEESGESASFLEEESDPDADIAPVDYHSDEEEKSGKSFPDPEEGNPLQFVYGPKSVQFSIPQDETGDSPLVRKIFYASRTHSQLAQFLQEIRKTKFAGSVRVVTLGSRQTYCINPGVRELGSPSAMNDKCLEMQKNKASTAKVRGSEDGGKPKRCRKKKAKCPFYRGEAMEELSEDLMSEIRDVESTVEAGKREEACPYYASRYAVPLAQLVLLPYQILLQESTRKMCGVNVEGNVVIVDEAHNLQEALTSIYSVSISRQHLNLTLSQLNQYIQRFRDRLKAKNLLYVRQLKQVISALLACLSDRCPESSEKVWKTIDFQFDAQLSDINFYKLINYMDRSEIAKKLTGFVARYPSSIIGFSTSENIDNESFGVQKLLKSTDSALSTDHGRNSSVNGAGEENKGSSPMFQVRAFLETFTYLAEDGRILKKGKSNSLRFLLLNPMRHFAGLARAAHSLILAGGTMHPEGELREELLHSSRVPQDRLTSFSCGHVIGGDQLLPSALALGPTGTRLNFSFENRNRSEVLTEFGRLLTNLIRIVPGGVVVFFPSYDYEARVVDHLKSEGVWDKLKERKGVFREPKATKDVESVLEEYSRSIRGPKMGALLFAVVGGKMSEGINFCDELGRCVMMVGLPFPNKHSPELKEKLQYLDSKRKTTGQTQLISPSTLHYESLCWKGINQSVGRAIRHKNDYAAILLVDERFCSEKTRKRLPEWIGKDLRFFDKNFGSLISNLKQFFNARKM